MSPRRAAVGFSVHTGWAAAVVVAGPRPTVLSRQRVQLHDVRFVYHLAAKTPEKAEALIDEAERTSRDRALTFLEQLARELPDRVLTVAIPHAKRALPPLEKILQAHPLIHAAEGELYRRAIIEAAERAGLAVELLDAADPPDFGDLGPPWGKDQRLAAALAWGALHRPKRRATGT